MLLNLWYTAWVDSAQEPESTHGVNHEPDTQKPKNPLPEGFRLR